MDDDYDDNYDDDYNDEDKGNTDVEEDVDDIYDDEEEGEDDDIYDNADLDEDTDDWYDDESIEKEVDDEEDEDDVSWYDNEDIDEEIDIKGLVGVDEDYDDEEEGEDDDLYDNDDLDEDTDDWYDDEGIDEQVDDEEDEDDVDWYDNKDLDEETDDLYDIEDVDEDYDDEEEENKDELYENRDVNEDYTVENNDWYNDVEEEYNERENFDVDDEANDEEYDWYEDDKAEEDIYEENHLKEVYRHHGEGASGPVLNADEDSDEYYKEVTDPNDRKGNKDTDEWLYDKNTSRAYSVRKNRIYKEIDRKYLFEKDEQEGNDDVEIENIDPVGKIKNEFHINEWYENEKVDEDNKKFLHNKTETSDAKLTTKVPFTAPASENENIESKYFVTSSCSIISVSILSSLVCSILLYF